MHCRSNFAKTMESTSFENELTLLTHQQNETEDEYHRSYENAVETVRNELGEGHPLWIAGQPVDTGETFTVTSPGDCDQTIGEFAAGEQPHVEDAVETASATFDDWRNTPTAERLEIFREAADIMRNQKYELAAIMSLENGKARTEAIADVDEAIDFLQFYSDKVERHDDCEFDAGTPTPNQHCTNILQPHGVFGVVAPFNFPLAILTGMTTGALITGNTAVVKPASTTPLIAHRFVEILTEAGIHDGVVNLVTGSGSSVGQPLTEHEDVVGFAFTGSREVGLNIQETFREQGKRGPVIAELGGKNPVIITDTADMSKAVSGVMLGAFSFSGQKCSATARVYVHESIIDSFTEQLVAETEDLGIGLPEDEGTVVSPLINDSALERYHDICEVAREDGTVLTGGEEVVDSELPNGRYVQPTIVSDIPHNHELAREEHFLPFVTIHPISDLDDAITKANDSDYGLCAGLFSENEDEIETWFDQIESGMCYVNRAQSATTGALVQAQPFGGWKFSGTTGKFAGGKWYLQQFMREQSRTVVNDTDYQ